MRLLGFFHGCVSMITTVHTLALWGAAATAQHTRANGSSCHPAPRPPRPSPPPRFRERGPRRLPSADRDATEGRAGAVAKRGRHNFPHGGLRGGRLGAAALDPVGRRSHAGRLGPLPRRDDVLEPAARAALLADARGGVRVRLEQEAGAVPARAALRGAHLGTWSVRRPDVPAPDVHVLADEVGLAARGALGLGQRFGFGGGGGGVGALPLVEPGGVACPAAHGAGHVVRLVVRDGHAHVLEAVLPGDHTLVVEDDVVQGGVEGAVGRGQRVQRHPARWGRQGRGAHAFARNTAGALN